MRMTKEEFVEYIQRKAREERLQNEARQRELDHEMTDYLYTIRTKRDKWMHSHRMR